MALFSWTPYFSRRSRGTSAEISSNGLHIPTIAPYIRNDGEECDNDGDECDNNNVDNNNDDVDNDDSDDDTLHLNGTHVQVIAVLNAKC